MSEINEGENILFRLVGMKFSRFLQFLQLLQFSLERAVSNSFTDYITVVPFIVLDEYSVLQQLHIPKGLLIGF